LSEVLSISEHLIFNILLLLLLLLQCWYGAWGNVVHYLSDGPGIDSRWCHWGLFSVVSPTEPRALRSTQPLKVEPGIFPGVKAVGAFGWRPTTRVVPKRQENPGP